MGSQWRKRELRSNGAAARTCRSPDATNCNALQHTLQQHALCHPASPHLTDVHRSYAPRMSVTPRPLSHTPSHLLLPAPTHSFSREYNQNICSPEDSEQRGAASIRAAGGRRGGGDRALCGDLIPASMSPHSTSSQLELFCAGRRGRDSRP